MEGTKVQTNRATNAVSASAPFRVLVVEPDADTRALYHTALPLAGCEVMEAADGREALTKALVKPPALILTEMRLPFVDGYALCQILRRDEATRSVPILIVTAEARPAEWNRIRVVGADAVLVKPIPPEVVLHEVRRLLTRSGDVNGTSAETNAAAQSDTAASALARSDERRTVLAKSYARFMTTTPPVPPPALTCPSCDHPLTYKHSHVGGVSVRHPEQWDYYVCSTCGAFQYRHRTRKLRGVD